VILRRVWWYSFTDVSGQPTESIFKVKAASVTNWHHTPRDVPHESTQRRKPEISYRCLLFDMGVGYLGTRALENTAQWNISGPQRQHTTEYRKKTHNGEIHSLYFLLLTKYYWVINTGGWDWWGMWHVWGRREMTTDIWCGNIKVSDHLGNKGVDRRIILKWMCKKHAGRTRTGSTWLRVETCRFRNVWDVSLPPAERVVPLQEVCSIKLASQSYTRLRASSHLSIFTQIHIQGCW